MVFHPDIIATSLTTEGNFLCILNSTFGRVKDLILWAETSVHRYKVLNKEPYEEGFLWESSVVPWDQYVEILDIYEWPKNYHKSSY
jgi:hypothetical protein